MRVQPASRPGAGPGADPADVQQRFQPFERQFDLPAQAAGGQHLSRRDLILRQGRGGHDVFRRGQTARIEPGQSPEPSLQGSGEKTGAVEGKKFWPRMHADVPERRHRPCARSLLSAAIRAHPRPECLPSTTPVLALGRDLPSGDCPADRASSACGWPAGARVCAPSRSRPGPCAGQSGGSGAACGVWRLPDWARAVIPWVPAPAGRVLSHPLGPDSAPSPSSKRIVFQRIRTMKSTVSWRFSRKRRQDWAVA